jgi:nucleoside-diphosphate-sugar epimerase
MQDAPKMLVFGGTGYLGSRICKEAVNNGFSVVAASRRGQNPLPDDDILSQVEWESIDAKDAPAVKSLIQRVDPDVVVHAVGLLFDIDSGLAQFNLVVSGSKSTPGDSSTYDVITRQTALNAFGALQEIAKRPFKNPLAADRPRTFVFTSAAEAGWPEVAGGETMDKIAPDWLKRYLAAKRSVESALKSQSDVRTLIYRPSLIWSWGKLDVLPIIPIFNAAAALGVPFVDKTVQVDTLAKSIVKGVLSSEEGVKRVGDMERLAER